MTLRELRLARGLSHRDVARALEINPLNVSIWEHGGRRPPEYWLPGLAQLYGVSLDLLDLAIEATYQPPAPADDDATLV